LVSDIGGAACKIVHLFARVIRDRLELVTRTLSDFASAFGGFVGSAVVLVGVDCPNALAR
jgi:hypothetical protein